MNTHDSIPEVGAQTGDDSEKVAQTQNQQIAYLIEATTVDTHVNIMISLLEKINFKLVQNILENTPADKQDNLHYKVLKATFEYYEHVNDAFNDEAAPEAPLITPVFR